MPVTLQYGTITEIPFRDWVGDHHYMNCAYRQHDFPVEVFRVNEDGTRELIRVE